MENLEKNVIWDFSYLTGDTVHDKSIFLKNSLNQFHKIENREFKSYVLADDILGLRKMTCIAH